MTASDALRWPAPAHAPALEDLARCVHCGLCISACPTYVVTGVETESPRGRIALARAVAEGELALEDSVATHWDRCLGCRACEAVCPSGVPYGRILERLRAQPPRSLRRRLWRFARHRLLRATLGSPWAIRAAGRTLRGLGDPRVRGAARRLGLFRVDLLRRAESQLGERVPAPLPYRNVRVGPGSRGRTYLFRGCVMDQLFGDVHRATIRTLAQSGWEVVVPREPRCCGALHAHDGDPDFAATLAKRVIRSFPDDGAPIVVNSAGCGAALREYADWLAEDPVWRQRARRFAARIRDYAELLSEGELRLSFPVRATYQDPCHLAHVQRIREAPRRILRSIDGLELIETPTAEMCCGAAGLYSLLQPSLSDAIAARKLERIARSGATVLVTANPGCQLQFRRAVNALGLRLEVLHLAQLVDRALPD